MVTSLSETAAFALGGWLFQWLGAAVALLADAMSYLASALCLRKVGEAAAPQAARVATPAPGRRLERCRELWRDITAGVAIVVAMPTLRALALLEGMLALAMSVAGTGYMIYVARDLALPTGQLGLIFALGGLGAVIGARLAAGAARRLGAGGAMTAGLAAVALGAACIPLASGAGWPAVALLLTHQIVGDGGHTLFDVHDRTLRQTQVEPALLARADAGIRGVGQCATLAGAGLGGVVGTAFGARGALMLGASVLALATIYAAARLRKLDTTAAVAARSRAAA